MENKRIKSVVVIGAGASGLPSIKACVEEGFHVVCYEKTNHVGGLWRYRDEDVEGLASVARSTIINSSKEITAFSDFPPPKHFPNYMHNSMMIKYLELYAEKFELVQYIKFRHEVSLVMPSDDYESTGRWKIQVKDLLNGVELQEVFDAVMVCNGHHVYPLRPIFPGEDEFEGRIIHTHSYKKPNGYDDKKVLVIGVGNSGGDAAVELSSVASKVYLSTRRGCWIIHRVGTNGLPFDSLYLSRFWNVLSHTIPLNIRNFLTEKMINERFNHELYQLKPKHRILSQHPMVNDALPNRILSGTVVIKGPIKRFVRNGVVFEGDDFVTEIDEVVLATGYEIKFPFLSKDIITVEENKVQLYKYIIPPQLKHRNLGIIGLIQIVGGFFPISEIQARWYARVLAGEVDLPSTQDMYYDIKHKSEMMDKRYFDGPRHTIQVDYVDYLDEMSSMIGAKPDIFKMFFFDFPLFWACFMGPNLPYQYRLQGPHAWKDARRAILDYKERVESALKTRYNSPERRVENNIFKNIFYYFMIFAFCLLFFIVSF
ncbi:dimethylaniline monooxygenase [N-oxide-forming] 5-like [Centruroides sculpturatus]|uniref:dimethylaniline monooxygenase [N-oxide-forming] 5-like n=1 Tax=Centruroides sculpturatus TaxID=218467 RepID=UPI000C6D3FB9|nr:dimethylaniline monooxygenase [N-oxide-forming] 5-like [Centruroides sculpturatus]